MTFIINAFYAYITWVAAFTIGFDGWIGWALLACAILQSIGTIWNLVEA